MKCKIKTFGIARDILGNKELIVEINGTKVSDLRNELSEKYPKLKSLKSLFIAVNQSYAEDHMELNDSDEIALIPPVSGG
jgi:molybdopterin converting factor subunit 1